MRILKIKKVALTSLMLVFLISCSDGEDGVNGEDGLNSLIKTTSEPISTNCENGGIKVETGFDSNRNGILETNEVLTTNFICSIKGDNSIINTYIEPSGNNCTNGGIKIDSGIDNNNNGILDGTEIQSTRFICNGIDGGIDEQIRLSFGNHFLFNSSVDWIISNNETEHLLKFNKLNYTNVDSIVVATRLATTNSGVKCFSELFNITENTSIPNTQLESTVLNTEPFEYVFSDNIYDDLPDGEIDLGLRIRSELEGTTIIGGFPTYIFIYRKIE